MSVKDPEEHLKTYEHFCAPRFKGLEDKVDDLNKIVNNGLKDKVQELKKASKWMLAILISLLVSIAGSTILLYVTNVKDREVIKHEILEEVREISD